VHISLQVSLPVHVVTGERVRGREEGRQLLPGQHPVQPDQPRSQHTLPGHGDMRTKHRHRATILE
jgi:hypothetical protein